jgi:hypothetical protein
VADSEPVALKEGDQVTVAPKPHVGGSKHASVLQLEWDGKRVWKGGAGKIIRCRKNGTFDVAYAPGVIPKLEIGVKAKRMRPWIIGQPDGQRCDDVIKHALKPMTDMQRRLAVLNAKAELLPLIKARNLHWLDVQIALEGIESIDELEAVRLKPAAFLDKAGKAAEECVLFVSRKGAVEGAPKHSKTRGKMQILADLSIMGAIRVSAVAPVAAGMGGEEADKLRDAHARGAPEVPTSNVGKYITNQAIFQEERARGIQALRAKALEGAADVAEGHTRMTKKQPGHMRMAKEQPGHIRMAKEQPEDIFKTYSPSGVMLHAALAEPTVTAKKDKDRHTNKGKCKHTNNNTDTGVNKIRRQQGRAIQTNAIQKSWYAKKLGAARQHIHQEEAARMHLAPEETALANLKKPKSTPRVWGLSLWKKRGDRATRQEQEQAKKKEAHVREGLKQVATAAAAAAAEEVQQELQRQREALEDEGSRQKLQQAKRARKARQPRARQIISRQITSRGKALQLS